MSTIQATSACTYCGGIMNEAHTQFKEETKKTCMHCGYQLINTRNLENVLEYEENGGYGTYHIHYKNGRRTYGRFQTMITGIQVESFIQLVNSDPSIDAISSCLIRFNKGRLQSLVGVMPALYNEVSANAANRVGERDA